MNYDELKAFSDPDDVRLYCTRPFSINSVAYATDIHIVVCAFGLADIEPLGHNLTNPKLADKIQSYCDEQFYQDGFIPLQVVIPPYQPCMNCGGNKKINKPSKCSDCDGEGEFKFGSHYYECKECDGTGEIARDKESEIEKIDCPDCNGSGRAYHAVQLDARKFQAKYLEKLLALPNIKYLPLNEPDQKLEGMRFRFDGGVGYLMPTT